jgi:hypothetical protein
VRAIRFRKLSRRYLDFELSTADDVAVRIVERPGLWMQQDEVKKMVEELRSVVVAVLDGRSLDYGVFTGEKQALDRAVVTLVYDRASGLPIAFNVLSLLRVTLRGREVEVVHLGLAMVHPSHRGRGLSAVLYGLTCTLLFFRSQMRPMWVTNVSQVPSVVGLVGETLSNVYPSPDPLKHRSFDHLVIAREIMKRHRRVFGVAAAACFDERRFVITNAYTGGSDKPEEAVRRSAASSDGSIQSHVQRGARLPGGRRFPADRANRQRGRTKLLAAQRAARLAAIAAVPADLSSGG